MGTAAPPPVEREGREEMNAGLICHDGDRVIIYIPVADI